MTIKGRYLLITTTVCMALMVMGYYKLMPVPCTKLSSVRPLSGTSHYACTFLNPPPLWLCSKSVIFLVEFTMCAMITHVLFLSVVLQGAKPQVPLKLKGYRFFFLLDKEGEFMQPTLFDKTVGIKRF